MTGAGQIGTISEGNRQMKHHSVTCSSKTFLVMVGLAAGAAQAQIVSPLYVGNSSTSAKDPLGRNLPGCSCTPDTACPVEIREVGAVILPPDPETGQSPTNNPWVRDSYMGFGVIGVDPGKFSETFEERLVMGRQYFARVFYPPPPAQPIYFANSYPFAGPPSHVETIDVVFRPLELISGEQDVDTDGDGIPDAMENNVTGTIPSERDSDGDGWDDYYEVVHGGPLNASEPNPIDLLLEAAAPPTVSWWTIPGLGYRLGYYDQAENPHEWNEVWSGTATDTNLVVDVEEIVVDPKGFFRVWAVTDSP